MFCDTRSRPAEPFSDSHALTPAVNILNYTYTTARIRAKINERPRGTENPPPSSVLNRSFNYIQSSQHNPHEQKSSAKNTGSTGI